MNKWYVLTDKDVLTPEAVRAILAKEALIRASQPTEAPSGNLITASGNRLYVFLCAGHHASDSAEHFDEDDALLTMLASEDVLRGEWDTPEEDEAWANLLKVK